uniref:MICOS complex subunit n=1 Tax=Entomoneis paludosa TaxID=265537 RepID=A0A7S2YS37_9STRA|mmetsp:Transcript_787/g.1886  ORF Transcript_787/g.1886 Transcript_787/m.1886 type:complete len:161 (+) Transcript_787:72-554(+)
MADSNSGGGDNNGESMEEKMRSMLEAGKEQYSGVKSQVGSIRGVLKGGIKATVDAANDGLAKIEESTISIQKPVVEGMKTAEKEGAKLITQGSHIYERRHEYGPHIVGGSSLLLGGLVGLRRGRIPGAVSAAVAGGLSYAFVYEPIPLPDLPDMIFGKKE